MGSVQAVLRGGRVKRHLWMQLFLLGAVLSTATGCTVVGYGIGAIADVHHRRDRPIALDTLATSLHTGDRLEVDLTNGNVQFGHFITLTPDTLYLWQPSHPGVTGPDQHVALPTANILHVYVRSRPVGGRVAGTLIGLGIDAIFTVRVVAAIMFAYTLEHAFQ